MTSFSATHFDWAEKVIISRAGPATAFNVVWVGDILIESATVGALSSASVLQVPNRRYDFPSNQEFSEVFRFDKIYPNEDMTDNSQEVRDERNIEALK